MRFTPSSSLDSDMLLLLLKWMSGQRTTFSQVLKVQFEDLQTVLDLIKVHLEYLGSTFHKLWIMGIWVALWGHTLFPGLYKSALWGSLLQNRVRPRSITGWIAAWALCGGDEVPRWPIKPKIPPIKPIPTLLWSNQYWTLPWSNQHQIVLSNTALIKRTSHSYGWHTSTSKPCGD